MSDTTNDNDIDGLLCWLSSPPAHDWDEKPSKQDRYYRALTALLAERNRLKRRVAELEAQPPAVSDLRERLLESALRGVSPAGYDKRGSESVGRAAVWMVDAAIAAMRKGEQNAE